MSAHELRRDSEGTNIDLLAEACLIGFGFQDLDLVANPLIGSAARPFGL
jgi:hypothetical protein